MKYLNNPPNLIYFLCFTNSVTHDISIECYLQPVITTATTTTIVSKWYDLAVIN